MITNKIVAAHILRLYCWEILREETGMSLVNGVVPILPIEDEPKVADASLPYCIYGYAENESRNLQQIRTGVFSLRTMSPSWSKLVQITNTIGLAFESSDVATEAVNRWSSQYPNQQLQGIRFTNVHTSFIEGGEAPETEGGDVEGVVNLSFEYINSLEVPVPELARGGLWS